MGYLTYATNWRVTESDVAVALNQEQSGMSTMVVYDSEKYHIMTSLQFGIPYTYYMLAVSRKFTNPVGKFRCSLKYVNYL
jgi:hypothetical protein